MDVFVNLIYYTKQLDFVQLCAPRRSGRADGSTLRDGQHAVPARREGWGRDGSGFAEIRRKSTEFGVKCVKFWEFSSINAAKRPGNLGASSNSRALQVCIGIPSICSIAHCCASVNPQTSDTIRFPSEGGREGSEPARRRHPRRADRGRTKPKASYSLLKGTL